MSIFKRLFGEKDDLNNGQVQVFKPHVNNSNIKSIGLNLQKRFSRGVQYNMKIVIRGDRNVGKSALLARLKGLDFSEQYIPTNEIEVACVHWNYKSNDDIVKVEVWDVVDKGRKKKSSGLKLENDNEEDIPGSMCLDAEFLDVYKGTNAVIIVLDITKSWTLNYVERELQGVPDNIPVLVLANHRDMGSHRTVTEDQIQSLIESIPSYKNGIIKYWESSMKNGYGLIYIHKFFNIPFLQLQKDTLLKQLATNEAEMGVAIQELEDLESDPDSFYDNFISNLKHPKVNVSLAQKPSSLTIASNPSSQINSPSTPVGSSKLASKPQTDALPTERNVFHPPQARPIPGMEKLGLYPLPVPSNANKLKSDEIQIPIASEPILLSNKFANKKNIEEFVPEDQPELSSFLDDLSSVRSANVVPVGNVNVLLSPSGNNDEDEDEDEDEHEHEHDDDGGGKGDSRRQNPMVSSFQDDIDINDVTNVGNCTVPCAYDNATSSSDENVESMKSSYRVTSVAFQSSNNIEEKTFIEQKSIIESTQQSIRSDSVSENDDLAPVKPYIELNLSDIDYLEHITCKKELEAEPSNDANTINSSTSTTKKKKKKHHKDSGNKNQQSSKKKRKSKLRSRDSSPKESNSKSIPQVFSISSKPLKELGDRVVVNSIQNASVSSRSDRSDSLERFLND